jgi:hypothetical protein
MEGLCGASVAVVCGGPLWFVCPKPLAHITIDKPIRATTVFIKGTLRLHPRQFQMLIVEIRWDEKAGLRRDAVGSQVIDVLEAQEIKETGNEED